MNGAEYATSSWSALGTTALVRVSEPAAMAVAETLLRRELAQIDRAASSYRPDSELTYVNACAGSAVTVSQTLHQAVCVAIGAAQASDGLVDPTLGAEPGWREVDLLSWAIRVPSGASLDLGATAKALAADRAADAIARATDGAGVLVALGGDIAVAGPAPAGGWLIHVTDDHRLDATAPGQTVCLQAGGLATSGTTVRRGPHGVGHHIIDPRTRMPATGPWRTASVTAADCVDANTAATAAIVLGEDAPAWLESHGLSARLVADDGAVVSVGGWPEGPPMPAVPAVMGAHR